MNNISFKQVVAIVLGISALLGAAWKIDARYTTREIHELKAQELKTEYKTMISDMQKQMIQIQRNNRLAAAQNQLWYWQNQCQTLEGQVGREPYNNAAKAQLTDAKRQRDFWQREVHKLMNQ